MPLQTWEADKRPAQRLKGQLDWMYIVVEKWKLKTDFSELSFDRHMQCTQENTKELYIRGRMHYVHTSLLLCWRLKSKALIKQGERVLPLSYMPMSNPVGLVLFVLSFLLC